MCGVCVQDTSRLSQSKHATHDYQSQQIQPDAMLMSVNLAFSNPSVERPIDVILQQRYRGSMVEGDGGGAG
jgi:hypothetical protein